MKQVEIEYEANKIKSQMEKQIHDQIHDDLRYEIYIKNTRQIEFKIYDLIYRLTYNSIKPHQ